MTNGWWWWWWWWWLSTCDKHENIMIIMKIEIVFAVFLCLGERELRSPEEETSQTGGHQFDDENCWFWGWDLSALHQFDDDIGCFSGWDLWPPHEVEDEIRCFRNEICGLLINLMLKVVGFGMRVVSLAWIWWWNLLVFGLRFVVAFLQLNECVFGLRIVCLAFTATATATVQARRPGRN